MILLNKMLLFQRAQSDEQQQQQTAELEQPKSANANRVSLPSIFERHSPPTPPRPLPPVEKFGRRQPTLEASSMLNRSIVTAVNNLSRLRAEIYLGGRKGGGAGVAPYTEAQLCKYVQLKIKLLLVDQYPQDYESVSTRFSRRYEIK